MTPHPSRYNGAILKKLAIFLKSVQLFRLQLGCSKEEQFCCVGTLLKSLVEAVAFGKQAVGFEERAVAS